MTTARPQLLRADAVGAVQQAVQVLRAGGLVAFPTDTVYGVGALAWDAVAVDRLYLAKLRPRDKAIPLLVASIDDLQPAAGLVKDELPPAAWLLAARFWPGPLTLIVPRGPRVSDTVAAGLDTVGVRVPDHPVTLALLRALAAPLAATSANVSGYGDALTADEVLAGLAGRVDLLLDGGRCPGGVASTVVDVTSLPPRLLRLGPISAAQIDEALAGVQAGSHSGLI